MLKLKNISRLGLFRNFSTYEGLIPYNVSQLKQNEIDDYGISLYSYMSVKHNETEKINSDFMKLTEELNSDTIDEKERKSVESRMNTMRKELGEKGQMTKLFDRYHKCILEISETREML